MMFLLKKVFQVFFVVTLCISLNRAEDHDKTQIVEASDVSTGRDLSLQAASNPAGNRDLLITTASNPLPKSLGNAI